MIALLTTALGGGCAREALPCLLPLDYGDLVISEVRGPQDGVDTRGEWFELYNATNDTIDIAGLRMVMTNLRGSQQIDVLIRESVEIPTGGYVVLGALSASASPPEVDYSFNQDFQSSSTIDDTDGSLVIPTTEGDDPRSLFDNARVELYACENLLDAVIYTALPPLGTYSLSGTNPPDADENDDSKRWCNDQTEPPPDGPQTELGLPGSPGEANIPCSS